MAAWDVDSVATELLACEDERRDRVKFTDEWPELDVETGYQIQDETLRRRLERGERLIGVKLGLTSRRMLSGAGHDAMIMADITNIGLVFVPSRGGRSHCPEEWTDYDLLQNGIETVCETVQRLACE